MTTVSKEKIIRQLPYQEIVEMDGQTVVLPFTNTFCEVRLAKINDRWSYVERQAEPNDPKESWLTKQNGKRPRPKRRSGHGRA